MTKQQHSLKTYTFLTYFMCSTAVLHNITCRWKCLVKTFYNRVPIVQNVVLMHRQITVTAEKVFGQAVSTSNHSPFCVAVVTGLIQCPLCWQHRLQKVRPGILPFLFRVCLPHIPGSSQHLSSFWTGQRIIFKAFLQQLKLCVLSREWN